MQNGALPISSYLERSTRLLGLDLGEGREYLQRVVVDDGNLVCFRLRRARHGEGEVGAMVRLCEACAVKVRKLIVLKSAAYAFFTTNENH